MLFTLLISFIFLISFHEIGCYFHELIDQYVILIYIYIHDDELVITSSSRVDVIENPKII